MKSTRFNHLASLVMAAALTIGLAACGGSSTKPDPAMTCKDAGGEWNADSMTCTSADDLAAQARMKAISDAKATLKDAQDALSALSSDATDTARKDANQAVATAADNLVTVLKANDGTADDIEAAVEAREGAEAEVTRLAKAISDAADAAAKAAQDAANARSMRVAEALLKHSTAGNDIPATNEFNFTDGDSVADITREGGAAKIKLNQTTAAAKEKPYTATASSIGADWAGMMYTYTDPKGKAPMEQAAVFTDIEKATEAAWVAFFDGSNNRPDADDTTGVLTMAATTDSRVSSNILPSAPSSTDSGTTREHAANAKIAGTFYGVSGTYSCGATGDGTCDVSLDKEGAVTFGGTALTFTPTIPAGKAIADVKVMYAVADTDFLHFGYWLQSTKKKDGTYTHLFRTFSGSELPAYSDVSTLRGSASYVGAAAGRYVSKVLDSDGTASEVSDGEFTADAELTATFGTTAGKVAAADQYAIKGTISNFMDGSTDLGWTLKLDKADLGTRDTSTGVVGSPTNAFTGTTSGSAGARMGSWSGTMFGAGDDAITDGTDYPTGVAGEFNGHFTNGHVSGAFGAGLDN